MFENQLNVNFIFIYHPISVQFCTEELGDYDPETHVGDYVAAIKIVLRQTDQLERKVMELHQKREPGQDVHIPIDEFMSIARTLETYGVDPYPVKVRLFD